MITHRRIKNMEETVNQETTTQKTEGTSTEQKTFTQEEMNRIVAERVQREKAKYADYESLKEKAAKFDENEEASKTELQKATEKAEKLEAELKSIKEADAVRTIRDEVSQKTGVPANLLKGKTKEDCEEEAKAIMNFAKSNGFAPIKDGGEPRTSSKQTTSEQFAKWMEQSIK
jgi:hypothetical protein